MDDDVVRTPPGEPDPDRAIDERAPDPPFEWPTQSGSATVAARPGTPAATHEEVAVIARRLSSTGLTSDVLHLAALGSIVASVLTWRGAKKHGDVAHAERFGIFVGLWAPTFFALADLVATAEQSDGRR